MSYSPPDSAKPFTLNVSDQDLSEWRQLLQLSKLPPDTWEGRHDDRQFGVPRKWLAHAKDYWLNQYDWRTQEKRINSFDNFKMQIEDVDVHFVAMFSEKKDAIPIIFMHGWPGSFIEFLPMCELIRKQYTAKDLPYHIVVPSLPGYTLSVQSAERSWDLEDTARIMNQLMLNLGFEKYIAQGGDVGSFEARIMAQTSDACVGIHLNLFSSEEKPDISAVDGLEKQAVEHAAKFLPTAFGYAIEHGTRPSTIGSVLSSNPLAILAWIGEKFLEWTDEDPSLDDILTNVSLYWFTSCFPRSIYPYRQLFGAAQRVKYVKTDKPTGFSFFPYELAPGVRYILEKHCNLVSYIQHERGGHFAALERPRELWADVEEFVGKAWKV